MIPASPFDAMSLERLIDVVTPHWHDAEKYRAQIRRSPSIAPVLKHVLVRKAQALGIDASDAYLPHPDPRQFGSDGLDLGTVTAFGKHLFYDPQDLLLGVAFLGSIGSGKTTACCHVVREAHKHGIGVLIPDLRGDFWPLASSIPDALLVPFSDICENPLEPPPGVPLRQWLTLVSARFCQDLGLQFASQSYVIGLFTQLADAAERLNAIPTLLDLQELLATQKPRPRSSEEGYWERVSARVRTLIDCCGTSFFGAQRGFPFISAVESGRVVILDLRVDRFVADFVTASIFFRIYFGRLLSRRPLTHKPLLVVFDEQRNLLRAHNLDNSVPDIELAFSRSRALSVGLLVCEQCPSQISTAILTACRARFVFNTADPELFYVGARLLGLSQQQMREITKFAPGECVAHLTGPRIPGPFRFRFPAPKA